MASDASPSVGFVVLLIFCRAYSLGGGTYTGIEAVSNGLPILREPRVATGKRTMLYMAVSLAFTAGGILFCYLLWRAAPEEGKTMNAVLLDRVFGAWTMGRWPVGAMADGPDAYVRGRPALRGGPDGLHRRPRVLSNMAVDSWVPHRFAQLSERLVTKHGILIMGISSALLVIYTRGKVSSSWSFTPSTCSSPSR